jgi:nitrogen fixation/metabolism regulation signal transduction histidine kinase
MKRYYLALLSRLVPLILSLLMAGYMLAIQWYGTALTAFGIGCWLSYLLIRFLKRTVKDTKRLIEAIRFSELNISFRNFANKGLFPELIPAMEDAVYHFNSKLQQTEIEYRFYETLLNRIDSAILIINKANEVEWINKAALNEFGKPQPRRLVDFAAISSELPDVLEKIVPGETKIIKIQREGQLRQLAATAVIFSSGGKALKLISLKNIQSVLEESEADAWKKLIRVLTHEMMNSLTPIISLADTFSEKFSIQDPNSPFEGRRGMLIDPDSPLNTRNSDQDYQLIHKAMQTIHRRSKGLVDFVANYQKLARIPAPVPHTFLAREMMNDIKHLFQAEGIRFSFEIKPEDMPLFADRTQMEQVLINLIKNAREACAEVQTPDIKVYISKNEYQRPVIVVSDNGYGILPGVMDQIFVPFFTTKAGGSGIGLNICRQILISHGGNITVESKPGTGTKVTLYL